VAARKELNGCLVMFDMFFETQRGCYAASLQHTVEFTQFGTLHPIASYLGFFGFEKAVFFSPECLRSKTRSFDFRSFDLTPLDGSLLVDLYKNSVKTQPIQDPKGP
jgi:hypothetical protein